MSYNEPSKDEATIGMLLDIEHLYGEHEGRLSPILSTLIIAIIPILLYVYFGAFNIIPVWLFAPIEIFFAARIIMIIPGREKYRLKNYLRRLYDDYTSAANLARIRRIHDDGLVEYVNGKVFYAVKCYNGTCEDELQRTQLLRKFLLSMVGDFIFDCYILNDSQIGPIRKYYGKVQRFGKNTASMNFTKIVDMLGRKTKSKSTVQCTVLLLKGTRSDWKQMRLQIEGALHSQMAKAFKRAYLVTSKEELLELVDMDMDTSVNLNELLREKYKTGEYYNSKVIAYDTEDEVIIGREDFMEVKPKEVKPVVKPKPSTFHVAYKEDKIEDTLKRATPKPDYYMPIIVGGKSVETEQKEQRVNKNFRVTENGEIVREQKQRPVRAAERKRRQGKKVRRQPDKRTLKSSSKQHTKKVK